MNFIFGKFDASVLGNDPTRHPQLEQQPPTAAAEMVVDVDADDQRRASSSSSTASISSTSDAIPKIRLKLGGKLKDNNILVISRSEFCELVGGSSSSSAVPTTTAADDQIQAGTVPATEKKKKVRLLRVVELILQ